jgi:hypothetical protein
VRSSSRSAGAKRRRCRRSGGRRSSRVISGYCRSHLPKSHALPCPKFLPRKSAPAISATIYGRGTFATRPLDHALIRGLVVLKLWQALETFELARLMQKFQDGRDFDWDDLRELLNRAVVIDRERIPADCVRGFGFLANLTDESKRSIKFWCRRRESNREALP